MSIVHGIVCAGRGKATARLAPLSNSLAALLGESPVPGSLNLVADRPISLDPNRSALTTPDSRAFWRARIGTVPVLVYRYRHCPLHVLEIVSHVTLRDRLKLEDGDVVDLSIEGITGTPAIAYFLWNMLWKGHEVGYFSSDRDRVVRKRFGRLARLTQQKF